MKPLSPLCIALCLFALACDSDGVSAGGAAGTDAEASPEPVRPDAVPGAANADPSMSCRGRENDFVQVLTGTLDAGLVTRDSYRLSDDGDLSRASWTDDNLILGGSEVVNIGAAAYLEAIENLSLVDSTSSTPGEDDFPVSRAPFSMELAHARAGRPVEFVVREEASDVLDGLINRWRREAPLTPPAAGDYLWTFPAPSGAGLADVSALEVGCDDVVHRTVEDGLLGPDVVRAAPDDLNAFVADGRSGRARFIARNESELVYFGVLSRP